MYFHSFQGICNHCSTCDSVQSAPAPGTAQWPRCQCVRSVGARLRAHAWRRCRRRTSVRWCCATSSRPTCCAGARRMSRSSCPPRLSKYAYLGRASRAGCCRNLLGLGRARRTPRSSCPQRLKQVRSPTYLPLLWLKRGRNRSEASSGCPQWLFCYGTHAVCVHALFCMLMPYQHGPARPNQRTSPVVAERGSTRRCCSAR